jgi:hypothetical protein
MPTPDYALTMASYNLWQNKNLTDAASSLTALERQNDRGAFLAQSKKPFPTCFGVIKFGSVVMGMQKNKSKNLIATHF